MAPHIEGIYAHAAKILGYFSLSKLDRLGPAYFNIWFSGASISSKVDAILRA